MNLFDLALEARNSRSELRVILLANNTPELARIAEVDSKNHAFDRIFTWTGDGSIFVNIVQYVEDLCNVEHDTRAVGVRCILMVEDSIQFYSSYLPVIYGEIWNHNRSILGEELTLSQKTVRQERRPKFILATNFEDAVRIIEEYGVNLLCAITDLCYPGMERPTRPRSRVRVHRQ